MTATAGFAGPDAIAAEVQRRSQPLYAYYRSAVDQAGYCKHLEFFAAGAAKRERALLGGNRSGKSVAGSYELACHLTGIYPRWWRGRRFGRPIRAWVAGDTSKTVRDILQAKLIGPPGQPYLGMVPVEHRVHQVAHRGLADTIETLWVRHATGEHSTLGFKSYNEGRESFQGTELDVIWLDEEPPMDIYGECLIRTMTTDGLVMLTFTPLRGLSEVVLTYMPEGMLSNCPPAKYAIQVGWDDAPHLTEQSKRELAATIPAYQLEARRSGVPQLGSGAIYTVAEEEFVVDPFAIPKHWPRCFGLDVGYNNTACVWLALDRATDAAYIYDSYKRGGVEPAAHEAAIAGRGAWIPGVVDPAAIWREVAGKKLLLAENEVEYGIDRVYRRLASGKLKLFRSCASQWLGEYRTYRRDDKGRVVKEMDHLMDATRYAVMSGLSAAKVEPEAAKPKEPRFRADSSDSRLGWMA